MQEFVDELILVLEILFGGFILFAFIMASREWIGAYKQLHSERKSRKDKSKNER